MKKFFAKICRKNGIAKRIVSMSLALLMVLSTLQVLPAGILVANAAGTPTFAVTDTIAVKVGETTYPMSLFANVGWEAVVALEADSSYTGTIVQNGEETSVTKTTTIETAGKYCFRLAGGELTIEAAPTDAATIAGSIDLLDDTKYVNWSPNPGNTNADMTYIGGNWWLADLTFPALATDTPIEYKVAMNHAWDVDYGKDGAKKGANIGVNVPVGSTNFKVLFYLKDDVAKIYDNVSNGFVVKNGCSVNPFADNTITLIGSMNSWNETDVSKKFTQVPNSYGLYTYQESFAVGTYEYKCKINGEWPDWGNNTFTIADDNIVVTFVYDATNNTLYDSVSDKDAIDERFGLKVEIPKVPFEGNVTVHYKEEGSLGDVYIYAWEPSDGENKFLGEWPGTKLTENSKNTGWYGSTLALNLKDSEFYTIFNNNEGSQTVPKTQTKDILVDLTETPTEVWITGGVGADAVISTTAPDGWNADGSYTKEVTLHYYNEDGWSNVYAHLTDDTFPGVQATKDKQDDATHKWYTVTLSGLSVDIAKVVMNGGTEDNKDSELNITLSNSTNEYWIKGEEVLTENPDALKSPVVNGNQVTFNYEDKSGNNPKVQLAGEYWGSWSAEKAPAMTKITGTNVYTIEQEMPAGKYEYKFIVEGFNDWLQDPLNPNPNGGNSILIVPGMKASLTAEKGKDFTLPTSLTYVDETGAESPHTVSYQFKTASDDTFADLNGNTLKVDANSDVTYIELIATSTTDNVVTAIVKVKLNAAGVEVITSPVVNGNQVTFNYEGNANTVSVQGGWDAWKSTANFSKVRDGLWSYTMELAPGKYDYKFIVDGDYVLDPENDETINDGNGHTNSLLIVPGLTTDNTLIAQRGEEYTLPTQLNCVDAEGKSSIATVEWSLKDENDTFVTLANGKLTPNANCEENSVVLVATAGNVSSDVTVRLYDKIYTYTIYTYSPIESKVDTSKYSLWIWDNAKTSGHPDENYAFIGTQVIDGKTWLKTEVRLPYADSLGIIFRTKEDWTWQSGNMLHSNKNKENQTLYIIDGIEKVFTEIEDATVSYMTIEYTRGDGAYTNPYVEAWWNGYSYKEDGIDKNYTYDFEVVNGKYIATVPVALGDEDMKVGFNVWNNGVIDGDAQTITIKAGEKLTKVKFANGIITNIVPASTSYVIKHKEGSLAGKISFYYRDEALFAANNMHSINKVELVTRTKVGDGNISDETRYTMVYDSENERFELEDQTLVADSEIYYYFVVNETTTKLDVKNNRTVNIGGTDYSLIRNRAFDVQLIADVEYDSMTYNDGNVIYLTWSAKTEGADISGFNPEKIYVDLSSLGLGNKVEMDIELNALSFGCLEGTKTGEKTIKVTVLDDCDLEYTTTTTVNVTARNKGTDFDWDEAVIYFAVTDRFFDGNEDNNDGNPNATVNDPSFNKNERGSYHGGDFAGLTKKMGYLADLGVNTIWLTPIVDNVDGNYDNGTADCDYYAYHGYWADDFTKLNSHLGTEEEFKALIDAAHAKGIKIMVDVVINHSGYDTKGLQVFNGMHRTETLGNEIQKELDGLPDFLTEDPEVRAQIINWQTDWMKKYDIDYYRIDTVKHVDNTTWNAFKNELVKANQDFKIIGEYWDASYLNDYDQLDTGRMDSVLDFAFSGIMMKLVNNDLAGVEAALAERNTLLSNTATVGSFTSSHDQDGLLTKFKSENPDWAEALMKVAATFQITAKGQPIIYYGEEIGMSGLNNWPYYTNRLDFDWDELEEQKLDENSMYNHYKTMLNIRRDYSEVFAKGTRNAITADSNLGYEVFSRSYEGKTLYVGVNVHGTDRQATFYVPGATGTVYTDLYSKNTYKVAADGSITVTIPKASNGGTAVLYSSSATVVDKDEITLKVHYSRPDGDYTGWNLWAWEEGLGGAQYNFELVNGERIATYSGIPGRATSKIAYIIRKSTAGNAWAQKDVDADQWIDVSTILSGTVHYYVNAGTGGGTIVLGSDVVVGSKLVSAEYNRKNNTVVVTLSQVLAGSAADAFTMKCATTNTAIGITSIEKNGSQYTLSLDTDISDFKTLLENTYTITFDGITRNIIVPNIYATQEFEDAYTYTGNDLGLTYTSSASTFKLWAPTANSVKVNVYESGTKGTDDLINSYPMVRGEKGVWSYTLPGDWNGKYYTYTVDVANAVNEVCDPYARTTGVNGNRAMILNLDSTDPTGWDADETRWKNSLHKNMNYTDAVIYELHVRDLTIDDSSGVNDAYQGKFMGLTQTGTKTGEGYSTALDHMINLGITHLHLIPVYDYGSVDETKLDTPQYNWGYDPVNYNVPEGSYSTNPYDGSVRVKEMKQMVKTLHDNNINVVMDVVYNHVYDAGSFSFNLVVPKYFSRTNADGTYSNGSGCGNDTASERSMVRKYIVDSILYWHEEYHIDGFRFDLVGLIDADTINQIVAEVHAKDKDIIFYGEGWTMNTAAEPGTIMATQANSTATNDFAFFNDTMRNGIAGNNDANGYGVVFGNLDRKDAEKLEAAYLGRYEWCKTPSETINYASCHDNYTLMDKINIAYADDTGTQPMTSYNQEPGIEQVKLNNLSAAYYMFAQGIPLVHAGEDMLRTKFDEKGEIIHNSYNSSDYVNKIRWSNLDTYDVYADTVEYYKGLIAFRKNHEAIRLAQPGDVSVNVKSYLIDNGQVMLYSFAPTSGEVSDGIITIYNAKTTDVQINIYDSDYSSLNITSGDWYVCVNADDAGTKLLAKVGSDGKVTVKSRSAMALVKIKSAETASYKVGDDLVDTDSVYTRNNVVTLKFADNQKDGITTGVNGVVALKATTNIPATLTWVSSNTAVATVDAQGRVTAVAEGSAIITVSTYHGVEATCVVTVTSETVEESIAIDKTELSLVAGESDTLVITISPAGTTATYESSDESVATIDETGKVTAVAAGSATVKATLANGQSVSCTVTVEAAPEQETVSLSKDTMSLEEGDSEKLVAVVTPAGTTVTFSSKNTNVATVDQYGNVTAVAEGSAEIIVVTSTGKTAICTVTVTKPESNQGGSEPGVDEPEPSPSEPEPTPTPNPVPSTPDSDASTGAGNGAAAGVNPGATTTKPAEPTPTTPATPAAPTTPKVEEEEEATVEVKTEAETEVPETVEEVTPVVDEKLQNAIANETEKILEDVLNEDVSEEVMTEETLEKVKEALENGDSIITEIIVDKLDEADVKAEVKEAFEKVLAESFKDKKDAETKIAQYLDLSVLLKTTQGQELGAIHKLSKEMTFTIAVPEDLVKDGRTFVVLRMHEGVTTVLDTLMNADGTLSFKTDRFSEYALAYVDAQPEDATDDVEGTEGDVPSGATTTEDDGNNMTTFVVVGLVIVILVALAGIFFALKRKKNN